MGLGKVVVVIMGAVEPAMAESVMAEAVESAMEVAGSAEAD